MRQLLIIIIGAIFMAATAGGAIAEDMSHDHGSHGTSKVEAIHEGHQPDAQGHGNVDHSGHSGDNIQNSVVDGYRFAFHLIDIREKMAAMKSAGHAHEGMDATHHLMVYIHNPNGEPVETAKVGFLVKGPDGSTQKLMAMAMSSGYGSDVNFSASGEFSIKIKAVIHGESLVDEFAFGL